MGAAVPDSNLPAERPEVALVVEGWFTVDRDLRIVEWDEGAEILLGVSRAEAIGQECYRVIAGLDDRGRAVCGPNCPVHRPLRLGLPMSSAPLVIHTRDGRRLRVVCQLFALPDPPGGVIGRLRPAVRPSSELVDDLALTSALLGRVLVAPLQETVDQTLRFLIKLTGAQAGEVWLIEPGDRSVVFVGHQGAHRLAFTQITHFGPGEGFPGVILLTRRPVYTDRLPEQPFVLRSRLRHSGLQAYVGIPLTGAGGGLVGTIGVAFQEPRVDFGRALRLLGWVGTPLGLKIDASLTRLREAARAQFARVISEGELDLKQALRSFLAEVVQLAGADGGELHLLGEGLVARHGLPDSVTAPFAVGIESVYGPRAGQAEPIWAWQTGTQSGGAWCWVPMLSERGTTGVIMLYYRAARELPAESTLAVIEHFAAAFTESFWTLRTCLEKSSRVGGPGRIGGTVGPALQPPALAGAVAAPNGEGPAAVRLEIRCLGPFELVVNGRRITPAMVCRKKALTLLKILLAHNGRPLPKEALIDRLWPGAEPETKASQFHVLVHELRALLEPGRRDQGWVYICNEGDRYYFNVQAGAFIDAREFSRLAEQARQAEARGDWDQALKAYEQAVQLYRGDYFEDEPYADWCWQQREHLRELYLEALGRLADIYGRVGRWEESIRYLRRGLELDPVREEFHSRLMYALWALGRRTEAVRQYEVYARLLQEEFGLTPLPETQELLKRIQAAPYPDKGPGR